MKPIRAVVILLFAAIGPTAALDNGVAVVSNDISGDGPAWPVPPPAPAVAAPPPAAYDTWLIDGRLVQVPRGTVPAVYAGPAYGQAYGGPVFSAGGCPGGYCR